MEGWEFIEKNQANVVKFLVNSYRKNRLVHAYILEGPEGVGKLSVAKHFAKMLLCESDEEICHCCRPCQLIENDGHANVFHLVPDGQSIKKEQIQYLQTEFSKKAVENSAKIYIIEEADKMSVSASNSLLKFLEEPVAETYALLLTQNKEKIIPTIRSRAATLAFLPVEVEVLIAKYKEAGISKNINLVAALTQNIQEAKALSESESLTLMVELVLKTEECLIKTGFDPAILMVQNQDLMKELGTALRYLKLYMIYYRDVLSLKLGKQNKLSYSGYMDYLNMSQEANTLDDCISKLKKLMEAERRLLANANVLLCFEQLFLEMKGSFVYAI